jgi:P4 family phage/plasmid primase-like protien
MTHPAITFLRHLDVSPEATYNIEHYTDVPKNALRPRPDPLAGRHANMTLQAIEGMLPNLQAINDQGAGIFVARNQCSGHRSEKNVTRVRGVHADLDGVSDDQLAALAACLQPTMVVQSSEIGRYQLYWQLAEAEILDKMEAKAINQSLVAYGADPAAVDVSRLLRLPGFKHMKYRAEGRTPTVTAMYPGRALTAREIRIAFPTNKAAIESVNSSSNVDQHEMSASAWTKTHSAVVSEISAKHPQLWSGNWESAVRPSGEIGYPSQSEADLALAGHIARSCRDHGISGKSIELAVEDVFSSSTLGQTQKWQAREDYRRRTIEKVLSAMNIVAASLVPGTIKLESHGDIRNARAFAQVARGRFLYVTSRDRWLQWIDERWQPCEKEEHFAIAKEVCGQILAAAGAVLGQDQDRGRKLVQEAVVAHSLPRMAAMLKLSISEPEMATTDRELDSDPYILGVQNGLVDLRTGQHLSNKPEFRVTRYCNASFDATASCPRWVKFLDQIFQSDGATIKSVQRLLGCTLLGLAIEEILIICYGFGSNGKSVFSNVVHNIMGGYSITAPPSLLTARRQEDAGPRNDLAALAGSRYVSINELQAGDRLDEQVVKMLAGREPISARFLHQEFFEFIPGFTPWLRTNHKPIIQGVEDGIWRRLVLIKFGVHFSENEKDPILEQKLLEERNGILMWMIEGAQLYLKDGICISPSMRQELNTYRSDSDLLGEFLTEKTIDSKIEKVTQTSLYSCYKHWSLESGLKPMTKKSFTLRLAERGYKESKSGGNRFYVGLTWMDKAQTSRVEGGMDGFFGDSDYSPF